MKTARYYLTLLVSLCCAMLVSCVSVTYPEPTNSELELGKTLVPPEGKGLLVAYRKPGGVAGKIPTRVHVDGKPYGGTRPGTFVVIPVSKGRHVFHLFADNQVPDPEGVLAFPVNISEGECLFIHQWVDASTTGYAVLPAGPAVVPMPTISVLPRSVVVSKETGRAETAGCKQLGGIGSLKVGN